MTVFGKAINMIETTRLLSITAAVVIILLLLTGCGSQKSADPDDVPGTAPSWTKDAVIYEVNLRQYSASGSFADFEENLEELWDMGINTLWFMPVYPISKTNRSGSLGSYYSVDDYCDTNPEFGTLEDFGKLADHAHKIGFHIVLDWVANHTGWDNAWISEHPDWYTAKNGKIISPEGMGWPDVADLNYDNPDMRRAMIESMAFWVKKYDIDGFRCDYAVGVPADFWAEARQELEKIKPLFFLEEDLGGQNSTLLEEAFDCNYAARFYETLVGVSHDKSPDKLKLYLQKLPENDFAMFYLDNHDVNSYDRTIMEGFSAENLPAMFGVIFTMPGMPMIYSGNEIGYDRRIAFMDKDPIRWSEGTGDYRSLISALATIKKDHPALYAGRFGGSIEYIDLNSKYIFAYRRQTDGDSVVCVFNLSKKAQDSIDWTALGLTSQVNVLFTGKDGSWDNTAGTVSLPDVLEPWEFLIISENAEK